MDYVMVTARMPQQKKAAVARVLERMGTNASAAINELYDYILQNGTLPFGEGELAASRYTGNDVRAALALLDSISLPAENQFSHMTDDEIRSARLERQ